MTEPKVSATPLQLGVRCDRDRCETRFVADFLIADDATRDERLQVVLNHVRDNEGWQVIWPVGDPLPGDAGLAWTYCPAHKTCPE